MTQDETSTNIQIDISDNKTYEDKELDKTDRVEKLKEMMMVDYSYPQENDPNFQYKIYKKREFYYHKIPPRPDINEYNDIKEYRDNICGRNFTLHEHQAMLGNFINPNTPYKGVLLFHGLGSGKCVAAGTYVTVNYISKKIEEIWNSYKTYIVTDHEGGQWSLPLNELLVKSIDNSGTMTEKYVKHLYREKVQTQIKNITLKNGYQIKITTVHKLLTKSGWTCDLKINDQVRINTDEEYSCIESINYIYYDDFVYDLEIEDTHNYEANGIMCHNTCAAISITEKFKDLVHKYNTKIYVLISGPLIRENWKKELLMCTGETYKKYVDKSAVINPQEEERLNKVALNQALQYYRFMSYKSFYKRVLGEKIVDKKVFKGSKVKVSYRKTEEGDFERDVAVDRIYNLNNSVIVIDEVHNLTGNGYGKALKHIIDNSINLKVVMLSATPMKNLGDNIIELLNFIRPKNSQIERDRIFTNDKIDQMKIKDGGLDYLKSMAKGYVSHVRGADPLSYATRVDKGVIPPGLTFIKVIRCKMLPFQQKIYDNAVRIADDSLDRKSEAVANFAFPGLHLESKELTGFYGKDGISVIKNQLKSNYDLLNKKIASEILQNKDISDLIYLTEDGLNITGKIMKFEYIKNFSSKFYKLLKKIQRLVWGKKGAQTAFVYSNLVKVGIDLLQQIMLQNGYLEYKEEGNYQINKNSVCYFCGKQFHEHSAGSKIVMQTENLNSDSDSDDEGTDERSDVKTKKQTHQRSDSSTDYNAYKSHMQTTEIPKHEFKPSTFITITGGSGDEAAESLPEEKQKVLRNVFSTVENKDGKYIKFVLGSKVMNEGISLKNVGEVHIVDVHFNLGKVDQTVGRAIRNCSHYKLMNEANKFPKVNVYKYVITTTEGLSTEEELYQKAEHKYLLIKRVERALKEIAIDCPLNTNGNMFKEEIENHAHCGEPGQDPCPSVCDYTKCHYKCDDILLNNEFYDPHRKMYKKITKNNLDYSTFTNTLARDEIEYAKTKIKELYIKKHVYTLESIIDYVKKTYDKEKRELFDEFFVSKGLDELIPVTENDFNNFRDTVLDKFNRPGYLIYINKYYIFQPFDQNDDVPMYYRTTFDRKVYKQLTLYNYLKNTDKYQEFLKSNKKIDDDEGDMEKDIGGYDFDSVMDYYDNRDEYKYVGIIDKEINRRKTKQFDENKDIFKIREKRSKILDKKRGTGIASLLGATCSTSKARSYLEDIAIEFKLKYKSDETRFNLCEMIKNKMIELEKYAIGKDKITYIMVPANHPTIVFPLNLTDRVEYIQTKIKEAIKFSLDVKINTKKKGAGDDKGKPYYEIVIKNDPKLKEFESVFHKYNAKLNNNVWTITIE
jgi:hypothetical protein